MDGICVEWGEFVFERHKAQIYKEKNYPLLSEKIIFAQSFLDSYDSETRENRQKINEKIDLPARFLKDANRPNPRTLRYHSVTHPCDNRVTREFYAYKDGNAKRVYCKNLDNDKIELLFLGKCL